LRYHAEARWLSQGKVLKRFLELGEICQFMENKGKYTKKLRDKKFLCNVAFLCGISCHVDLLNMQLQVGCAFISDMHATVRAFTTQLSLWDTQMRQSNLNRFLAART